RLHTLTEHTTPVSALQFTPDGKQLVSTGGSQSAPMKGEVKVWDVDTGRNVRTLEGPRAAVRCLAVSPDGQLLATAGYDGRVQVWSLASGQPLRDLGEPGTLFHGLAFSPDGRWLAGGVGTTVDRSVRVWDVATG